MSTLMTTYLQKTMYKALIKKDIRLQMDNVVAGLTKENKQQNSEIKKLNRQLAEYKEIVEKQPLIEIIELRKKQGYVVPKRESEMAQACSTCLENLTEILRSKQREDELAIIYMEAEEEGVAKEDLEQAKQQDASKACEVARATVKRLIQSVKSKPPRANSTKPEKVDKAFERVLEPRLTRRRAIKLKPEDTDKAFEKDLEPRIKRARTA